MILNAFAFRCGSTTNFDNNKVQYLQGDFGRLIGEDLCSVVRQKKAKECDSVKIDEI
jgi:hypothetical protein